MRVKQFLKKYFAFNKRERNGTLILVLLVFTLIISNLYFKSKASPLSVNITPVPMLKEKSIEKKTESFSDTISIVDPIKNSTVLKKDPSSLFVFDPNTISEEQAISLGWSKKLSKVFMNYKSKGGKFKKKEDLKKLFGMTDKLYSKLEPYILIEEKKPEIKLTESLPKYENKKYEKKIVEINSADSVQLISLNGIGPALSRRILKFRNMIGGFHSKEQLKEVYGMKDTLYNLFSGNISVDPSLIKKININTATSDDLKKNTYIKFMVAQSIVNYRMQHGKFTKPEDLLNVGSISEEIINKLKPYLEF